jgi:hypothetical protein
MISGYLNLAYHSTTIPKIDYSSFQEKRFINTGLGHNPKVLNFHFASSCLIAILREQESHIPNLKL